MNATRPPQSVCPQCHAPFPATVDVPYPNHAALEGLVWCRQCTLVSLLPLQSQAEIEALYDGHGNWELLAPEEVAVPNRRRRKAIEARHGAQPGTIYDIGASHGAFLAEMQAHGWEVSGLEPAAEDARVTSERLGRPIDVMFFGPDTTPPGQYDVVTCWDVLEHMRDPAACLATMMRFVKPGGLLIIAIPHIDGVPAKRLKDRWRYIVPPYHIHFFPETWLREQAATLDAELLAIDGFAKVHAWAEALVPRAMQQKVSAAMPNRMNANEAAPRRSGVRAAARKLARRAVLQINQTPVPLPAADLIDVTFRVGQSHQSVAPR